MAAKPDLLRRQSRMSKILGIDLGTTNSCVAIVEATVPRVLANREGSRTTPSIVAFAEEGDRLVGQIAKRQAITNPENTVFAVKRLIGRKFKDPQVERARQVLPYTLVEAPNGDVKIEIRDRQYSPEEISALVLREIKDFAEEALGEPVARGGDHRPGLLQRLAAPGHQGRRQDRRPRGRAHHQRAHGRGSGLRPRPQPAGGQHRRLRPGRRHVRRLDPPALPGDLRGALHRGRHLPGRRGLRPADHGLADRGLPARDRDRPAQRPHGPPAPEGGGRARQVRALVRRGRRRSTCPFISADRTGPAPPRPHAHPRPVRGPGARPGGAHRGTLPGRPASRPACAPTRSTRCCWWAARRARPWWCRPSSGSSAASPTARSTRTRWWRSAPPSRAASCAATSRTWCCSTSPRSRSASRPRAACSPG